MIPRIPVMSDETVLVLVGVSHLPLVVDVSVPLYEHLADPDGLTRAVSVGYALQSGAVHVHPERLTEFHLRVSAATIIHYARHGFRSTAKT